MIAHCGEIKEIVFQKLVTKEFSCQLVNCLNFRDGDYAPFMRCTACRNSVIKAEIWRSLPNGWQEAGKIVGMAMIVNHNKSLTFSFRERI